MSAVPTPERVERIVEPFDVNGVLARIEPQPSRWVMEVHLVRGLARSYAEGNEHPHDEAGAIRPEFFKRLAEAIIDNERADAAMVEGSGAADWADLLATPVFGQLRRRSLLRVGGLLLARNVPAEAVLGHMQQHNRVVCVNPLSVPEVEAIWRSLIDRRRPRTAR